VSVANPRGVSRTSLYRDPSLRAVVDEYRAAHVDPRTLSGLTREVDHLRTAVELLADRVRHHEEQLRQFEAFLARGAKPTESWKVKGEASTTISRLMLRQRANGIILGLNADRTAQRQRWTTVVELSVAMADYIENFYNLSRRHSSLSYFTLEEFENLQLSETQASLA